MKFIIAGQISLCLLILSCKNATDHVQNRLANSSSPYLRQHADNPVNWYEWGAQALEKAKNENKPLLISIGYSSCHWCHEMEKESFMDTAVARLMNNSFVCIKIDREERPDIDKVYLQACQLLNNGEAGWPLNAFALPDGKPFYACTYNSKDDWSRLLHNIAKSYAEDYRKVELQAFSLTYGIIDNDSLFVHRPLTARREDAALNKILFKNVYDQIDLANGGLKGKQKFPTPSIWEYLLQYHYFTGDNKALQATIHSLEKMALGGIYDHVGGGFSRYSTDSLWRIPHFEKMLYDNAQLVSLYIHAWQVTKNEYFKKVAVETLDFIEKELRCPEGGFYSSVSAVSSQGEGAFYAWQATEMNKLLSGDDLARVYAYYHISGEGNWTNGNNILYATQVPLDFATGNQLPVDHFNTILQNFKAKLLAKRIKRARPSTDKKILTSWNALMLKAYIDLYAALGNEGYLKTALSTASFIENRMVENDGRLWRSFWQNNSTVDAFLDDYAYLAQALISLYEVTFDRHWLDLSEKIASYAVSHFFDENTGLFFYTSATSETLIVRTRDVVNSVLPASNPVMGEVLLSLGHYFQNIDYLHKSENMISGIQSDQPGWITASPAWGSFAGLMKNGLLEVAILGKDAVSKSAGLQRSYLPNALFMGGIEENLPLLINKLPGKGTKIYVCKDKICKLPVDNIETALSQIRKKQ